MVQNTEHGSTCWCHTASFIIISHTVGETVSNDTTVHGQITGPPEITITVYITVEHPTPKPFYSFWAGADSERDNLNLVSCGYERFHHICQIIWGRCTNFTACLPTHSKYFYISWHTNVLKTTRLWQEKLWPHYFTQFKINSQILHQCCIFSKVKLSVSSCVIFAVCFNK